MLHLWAQVQRFRYAFGRRCRPARRKALERNILRASLLHAFLPGAVGRRRCSHGALQCAPVKVSVKDPYACLQAADRCDLCALALKKGVG